MKKLLIVCAVLLVLPCLAFAGTLPDTGQTTCYDDVGNSINPCPQTGEPFYGQDANYAPCNPHSYTKLDASGNDLPDDAPTWVMVRDKVTGLIWENKTDDGSIHDKDNLYNWDRAQGIFIATANSQDFGGYSDWRLPTIKELSTLIDSDIPNPGPTINTDYFLNTVSSAYWSSTTFADYPSHAWRVLFGSGDVQSYYKSYGHYVRAVRGGQCGSFGDSFNFEDNEDGTVTDTEPGLMWEVKTDDGGPRDKDNTYTWQSALIYCENLTLAGYNDWRLPNRNELQSIVDYNRYYSSIDPIFSNTVSSNYWSSTTVASIPRLAWRVFFYSGLVGLLSKSSSYFVRAVRGGQCGSFGDSDSDGILDDGDSSGTPGDNPCTGGQTENCDDNCPNISNPSQEDADSDEAGDMCDNCPNAPDPGQNDVDHDCVGDLCDNCPETSNPEQENSDNDPLGDVCDNCPDASNPDQADSNDDGIGDVCDPLSATNIPTLSEWGLIIFMMIILGMGVVALLRRRI